MDLTFKYILFICLFTAAGYCTGQQVKNFRTNPDGVTVAMSDGILGIYPLTDRAVRIKFCKDTAVRVPELVFTGKHASVSFAVSETTSKIELKGTKIVVNIDKSTGKLSFADHSGKIFLSEKAASRKLIPSLSQSEPCFIAEQSFESPANEYLFGLGQFQDGHFNVRNVTRRLMQVNTQISIPFIYSSNGYGLLWHQYGLTDFNPADNFIALNKQDKASSESNQAMDVTTMSGTQRVSQNQSLYLGKFNVPADGEYSIFLDLGDMGNRHFVSIDGQAVIDQSNMWLPPAVGTLVKLSAGEHSVQVVCKTGNTPKVAWKLTGNTTTFRSPNARLLDYVVFYGPSADSVITTYRNLSGNVPLLPQWAYGFWQCRERYTSSTHLVETVKEFRRRNLPMDVIVQDWQYWGKHGWGVPEFDESKYPNPAGFIKELHDLNAHFSISVWENPDKSSEIGKVYAAKNLFIPNSVWMDMFNPLAQQTHWSVLRQNLFAYGVDSWWMDATEPENDGLKGTQTYLGLGDFYRLTYPLFVSRAVYEGQRAATSDKRVCILTRSAFLGQQRYGAINWSGDIGGTWDSFKRQIVAGLNYTITGFPYWTTDIGGFFRPGKSQYTDEQYHELLTRWFQWGAFNPIFRIHGYQTETEPWKYGQTVENNMRNMLNLRYRLLPYIYSEAWQVTKNGSTLMRPLVMDFREDSTATSKPCEYLFGKSILVAPVTEAGVKEWRVYLPQKADWYNFWDARRFKGGQSVNVPAPLDKIPLFVKAGSIIPLGKLLQYAAQQSADTLEVRIYKGADGQFDLYEDEGDGYRYENGNFQVIPFHWNEQSQSLTIGAVTGSYPNCLKQRVFNILFINGTTESGTDSRKIALHIVYKGKKKIIRLR